MPNQAWMHANTTYMFWLSIVHISFCKSGRACVPIPLKISTFWFWSLSVPLWCPHLTKASGKISSCLIFFKCLFSKVILEPLVLQVMMMVFGENTGTHHWSCLFQSLWYPDSWMYSAVFYSVVTVVIKWHNDWNAPAVKPCRLPAIIE